MEPNHADMSVPVIFFDGVCGLCNHFVDFVLIHDSRKVFTFSALQSDYAAQHLRGTYTLPDGSLSTIVLFQNGQEYTKSDAALRVLAQLGGIFVCFWALLLIPRFIRNGVYDLVARNRYRIFGKRDTCRVPTAEERSRFLWWRDK